MRLFFLSVVVLVATTLCAQTSVSGTVTDGDDPLIGVTIREKGRSGGTLTDIDGRYEISVSGPEAVLIFSYVSKKTQEEPVGSRQIIDVTLNDAFELEQVIVTGYRGAQDVKDLVGSYEEVKAEELVADRPVESLDQLLEGRIAGVQVQTVTGEPGLPIKVQIRGQSSLPAIGSRISASTQPLYILDGVPLFDVLETNTTNSVFGDFNNQALNPLSLINPDDIASISVLKDASATALYGADAANGVVLITTKQGQSGKARINVSTNYGTGRTINEIKFLNTEEYLELARETLFNTGRNPAEAGPANVSTNWREIVQRNPTNADLDLSLSGGNKGVTYRLSAGYSQNESVHRGNGLEQANLNLSLQFPLGDRLKLTTRWSGAYQRREGLRSFDVFSFLPNLPVRLPDGSFNNGGFFINRPNPAALLEQNENYHNSFGSNAQVTLEYQALTALKFRLLAGLDRNDRDQFQYDSALNGSGARRGGRLRLADNQNTQWITNGQAIWTPATTGQHHVSSLLGGELQRQNRYQQVTSGDGFLFDDQRRLAFLPDANTAVSESRFVRAKASLYGEVAYNYDYRYYLKVNGRRDASSIFGGDQQADIFWAVGSSWNFSNEPALEGKLPFGLDYGKLRASYGVTGNSRVGVYTAAGIYSQGLSDDLYAGQLPVIASTPANELLSWERKFQTNLALDLGWGERFSLTAEYYSNRTVDGLFSFDTPLESGFASILANAASIRNWGYEMTVHYETARKRKLHWSVNFNVARNLNRLLGLNREVLVAGGTQDRAFIVGQDINLLYGIPSAGVNLESGRSRWLLPDGTMTEDVTAARDPRNFVPLGRAAPKFFGGLQQVFNYGAFRLTAQINYAYGATDRVDRLTFTDGQQILINNQSVNQLDRWQQPGDVTEVPQLRIDNPPVSRSSRYYYELSYLQLSALSLHADLLKLGVPRLGLEKLRAFVLVNNVGYLYTGERQRNRNGVAEYRFNFPQQRAFTFGLKIGW